MKTFTVRDLDREPSAVLEACDRDGAVRVRRRNGRAYTIRPEIAASPQRPPADGKRWLEAHLAWLRQTFPEPVSTEQTALVDRLIAGE